MNTSKNIIIPIFLSVALAACEQASSPDNSPASPPASNSVDTSAAMQTMEKYIAENSANKQPAEPSSEKANPFSNTHSGEVLETFEANKLTYVNIKSSTDSTWAAGPLTDIKTGDMVGFDGKTPMKNFHSKSINRTFELIYFVSAFTINGVKVESKITATGSSSK